MPRWGQISTYVIFPSSEIVNEWPVTVLTIFTIDFDERIMKVIILTIDQKRKGNGILLND